MLRTRFPLAVNRDFEKRLIGYGLTTAEIHYRIPDHPRILQLFVWQEYDLCPEFPELQRFLQFWHSKLDGRLYSITVCHRGLIAPAEIKAVDGVFRLN